MKLVLAAAAVLSLYASNNVAAQVRPSPTPIRRDTLRARGDTTRRDSTAADATKVKDLIKWNEVHQFFLKRPLKPANGFVTLPETPGLGMDLDEAKIESQRIVRWTD